MRERNPVKRQAPRGVLRAESVRWLLWLPVGFLLFLTIAAWRRDVPRELPIAYLVGSIVTGIVYVRDKAKAERGDWRTPESALHFLDLLGGWPGGLVAQQVWRHKTRKLSFQLIFWFCVTLHLVFWGWVCVKIPAKSELREFLMVIARGLLEVLKACGA